MATRRDLAQWTNGVESQPDAPEAFINRVAAIEHAGAEACVFAATSEALDRALASHAGAILASAGHRADRPGAAQDQRILWVKDARYAFAVVAHHLTGQVMGRIDASALVAGDARIGEGTVVEAGVVVGSGVQIGKRCRIGARACVLEGTVLGDDVVVQSGAVLGADGFGYVRDTDTGEYLRFPQQGTLVIEDRVEIGANATIDRGALGETRIGRGTKIDNLVHIGHNCSIGQNVIIAAQTGVAGSSVIGDGAVLGGQVGIADHVTIGPAVILGAQAGVPTGKRLQGAGVVFWGTPARPIGEILRDLAKLRRL